MELLIVIAVSVVLAVGLVYLGHKYGSASTIATLNAAGATAKTDAAAVLADLKAVIAKHEGKAPSAPAGAAGSTLGTGTTGTGGTIAPPTSTS